MAKKIQGKDKKKAWDAFSRMIRLRDCFATTGSDIVGKCITCGKNWGFKQLQAGHAIAGRGNGVLFDDELVNAQCRPCNEFKNGRLKRYREILIGRHMVSHQMGTEDAEEWFEQKKIDAKKIIPNKDMDFEGKAIEYKRRYKEIMETNGHFALLDRLAKENKLQD